MTHTRPLVPDVPFYPGPTYRPPPKPIRSYMPRNQESSQSSLSVENINPDINLDFEEIPPFQEGVISETFQRLDRSLFQEPKELNDLINTGSLIQKFLPKQADIDKALKVVQRKVLKGIHLLVEIKEIQAGYLYSSLLKTFIYICCRINYPHPKQHLER